MEIAFFIDKGLGFHIDLEVIDPVIRKYAGVADIQCSISSICESGRLHRNSDLASLLVIREGECHAITPVLDLIVPIIGVEFKRLIVIIRDALFFIEHKDICKATVLCDNLVRETVGGETGSSESFLVSVVGPYENDVLGIGGKTGSDVIVSALSVHGLDGSFTESKVGVGLHSCLISLDRCVILGSLNDSDVSLGDILADNIESEGSLAVITLETGRSSLCADIEINGILFCIVTADIGVDSGSGFLGLAISVA